MKRALAVLLLASLAGCSGGDDPTPVREPGDDALGGGAAGEPAGGAAGESSSDVVYASSVEAFRPGDAAGYNQSELPGIVLGPPRGGGSQKGSLHVLSLGKGGEIVLGFGERRIVDGPGVDFVVFENAFWPEGDPTQVFAELGEVAVSEDGEAWHVFDCDVRGDGEGNFPGCAGVTPTLEYDAEELVPLNAERSGGDGFDLADLGLSAARFVRIRDLETLAPAGTASGFDLDAVGVIHAD